MKNFLLLWIQTATITVVSYLVMIIEAKTMVAATDDTRGRRNK